MKPERRTVRSAELKPGQEPIYKQIPFLAACVLLLALLIFTYSNHFHNPFQFDDAHTIVNNMAIRDLGNVPRFFSDASTFSTLPANQAWRPGLTLLNAIDAHFSKDHIPDPYVFHLHIFISYIFLGVLLFFFLLHVFRVSFPASAYTHWVALAGTGIFMLHTANAETINYVISRDDSFSTMMVLLAFVLYFYSPLARKYFLFILPVLVGFFVKEPALMFAPLLLVYILLFGEPRKNKSAAIVQVGLGFVLLVILFLVSVAETPPNHKFGGGDRWHYLFTQPFVMVHYFNNFLLPFNLSADTDWTTVKTYTDDRVITGMLFVLAMLFVAVKCWKNQRTKPISFGILWFFIALAPTSSFFPLSEVLNDHRPFFAYIGLTMALVCGGMLLLEKLKEKNWIAPVLGTFSFVLILLHAAGTHHRNEVWSSGETLWKDVTEKSPGNGRGWMNYGNALMAKADFAGAIACFNQGLVSYPNYSYLYINMGIAQNASGNSAVAEQNFRKAISLDSLNPECYYYFGSFLVQNNRPQEAKAILSAGKNISPMHEGINQLLAVLNSGNIKTPVDAARETAKQNPTADNYVLLSLALYNAGDFYASAEAAEQAAKIKPDDAQAWNNICAAYNRTGDFDKAEEAGKKATDLLPNDELLKNNYTFAKLTGQKVRNQKADAQKKNDENTWIALCMQWYNSGYYKLAMEAAQEATKIAPSDPTAWNDLCASANKMHAWDIAIDAANQALKLNPDFELAKNNLAEAERGKSGQ